MTVQRVLDMRSFRAAVRRAVADYMASEGCSCCEDRDRHEDAQRRLAALLRVPKYKDGSGYDFPRFSSENPDA